jgi:hypothetical protein
MIPGLGGTIVYATSIFHVHFIQRRRLGSAHWNNWSWIGMQSLLISIKAAIFSKFKNEIACDAIQFRDCLIPQL